MPRKTYCDNQKMHSRNHLLLIRETLVCVVSEEAPFALKCFPIYLKQLTRTNLSTVGQSPFLEKHDFFPCYSGAQTHLYLGMLNVVRSLFSPCAFFLYI